jgi:hypothetical protein
MRNTLFLNEETVVYQAPTIKEIGTIRYAPSFTARLAEVKLVGYVPRIIIDDESDFLVLVTATGSINYFSLDVADRITVTKLESIFNFKLKELPNTPFEETNWYSFIAYPKELAGQPLFKRWSWITPRGFLKNMGKTLSLDNPKWEQLTVEAQAYLAADS